MRLLERMRRDKLHSIEPAEESCRSWKRLVTNAFESTLFRDSTAWWTGANVPHKRVEPLVYLGGVQAWRQSCDRSLHDWGNFIVS
ncbi:cyclopentanone 1,2-monooxygenase [Colletotrichum tamarilloi]|nr:cyclopentanone 1,2-monooxygenase [Colletotrichum tamarilloi]KAK1451212.1 cyclopentanone 1,2-monooxygenase [Colletotrichum tamarilloi]